MQEEPAAHVEPSQAGVVGSWCHAILSVGCSWRQEEPQSFRIDQHRTVIGTGSFIIVNFGSSCMVPHEKANGFL
jgi:hypothetical protein